MNDDDQNMNTQPQDDLQTTSHPGDEQSESIGSSDQGSIGRQGDLQNDEVETAEPQEEAAQPTEQVAETDLSETTSGDQLQTSDNPNPEPAEDAVEPEQVKTQPSDVIGTPDLIRGKQSSQDSEDAITPKNDNSEETPETQEEQQTPELSPEDAATAEDIQKLEDTSSDNPNAKWYVVHTYSGHENKVATALKQRVESEHLEHKILDVIVPTQDKIEIRSGKKATVKEKIFPGYILVKMVLDDNSWLAVRTTQGVTSFVGIGNKPTPIPEQEVKTIVKFMTQGAAPTFKDVYLVNDTVKITDGPFAEFIGKVDSVDKEKGKVRVLVSIFGRETPVELDFLQVQKL